MASSNSTRNKGNKLPKGFYVVCKCDQRGPYWKPLRKPKPIGNGFFIVAEQAAAPPEKTIYEAAIEAAGSFYEVANEAKRADRAGKAGGRQ